MQFGPTPGPQRDGENRRPAAVPFPVYEAVKGDDGWYWRLVKRVGGEVMEALT
jgi:hypothetical protein